MFVIQPISGRWESNFACRVFRSKREKAAQIIRIVQSCESGMAEDLSRAGEVDECCETWCKIRRSALAVASAAGSGICKQFLMVMRLLACEVCQQPGKFQIVSEP